MMTFCFENLLVPCVTADRTDRKFAGNWPLETNANAVILSMTIIHFMVTTTTAYAVSIIVMESVVELTVCVPAVVSITTSVEAGKPLCSAVAEAVRCAENSAYADLPKIGIFHFEFIVNTAVHSTCVCVMEPSRHFVITPACIEDQLIVNSGAQKRSSTEHVQRSSGKPYFHVFCEI